MWTPVKGFEQYYEVNPSGQIRNRKTHRVLKPVKVGGYLVVSLSCNGNNNIRKYVHRLVAETLIPNPENKPTVNHKDGNKQNPEVTNLEWATRSENTQHAYASGLMDSTAVRKRIQKLSNSTGRAIQLICLETGKVYPSIVSVARELGVSDNCITYHIKNGQPIKGNTYKYYETIKKSL